MDNMALNTHLLTRADIEQQLLRPDRFTGQDIGICPVVELIELCELLKKGKIKLRRDSFRAGMQAIQDTATFIVALDQACLADALFDRDEYIIAGLWPPAANRNVSPAHSVRRLLLRPSDQTWWDDDIYAEAEAIYGIEELEIDTNA
jgi:hypothetical protein